MGGLHPELTLDWYCEMFRGLKQRFPQVHLKALTMVEIAYLARRTGITVRETLERLKAAGVDSLPGGGAEIFAERVRRIICDHKIDGDEWLEVARTAHQLGLHSNCTMLYGHIETDEDRVDHLLRLRALAGRDRRVHGVHPAGLPPRATRALAHIPPATGFDGSEEHRRRRGCCSTTSRTSRPTGSMLTPRIAQVAQRFGADDMDGTVVEEKIYHDAGATTSQSLRRDELLRLIREAGREPVERDTLYRPVVRTQTTLSVQV